MACTHRGLYMSCIIPANLDLSAILFVTSSKSVASKEKIVAQALI
jgi:hypothetical protein